jgi:putative Mn2+ efflux pump MntP
MTGLTFLALFAVLQNIDNLLLATAYRWQNIRIPWPSNFFIGALSGVFTAAAMCAAQFAKARASWLGVDNYTEVLGRGILALIGVWTLVGYFRARLFPQLHRSDPKTAQTPFASGMAELKFSEAVVPGTALALDNLGPSFAFGLVSSPTLAVALTLSVMTGFASVLAVLLGQSAGAKGRHYLRCFPPRLVAAGLILAIAIFDPGDFGHQSFKAPGY